MAVHDRLEEARADEAPRHAAQADEDAARADGVGVRDVIAKLTQALN